MKISNREGVARFEVGLLTICLLLLFSVSACDSGPTTTAITPGLHRLKIEGHLLDVELATNDASRARGLMYRSSVREDSGMLFIFNESKIQRFWMKNCLIPLDIAFIDDEGKIVNIQKAVPPPPQARVFPRYPSTKAVRYVLETRAGWFEDRQLKAGVMVEGFRGPPGQRVQ